MNINKRIIRSLTRTRLRKGERQINNSDAQIAKELGISINKVQKVTSVYYMNLKHKT